MGVLSNWVRSSEAEPEIILNITRGEEIKKTIKIKRNELIKKLIKLEFYNTIKLMDVFKAVDVSLDEKDILNKINALENIKDTNT